MNHLTSMKIISPTPLMTDIGLAQAPWVPGIIWGLTSPSTEWARKTINVISTNAHLAYIHKLTD